MYWLPQNGYIVILSFPYVAAVVALRLLHPKIKSIYLFPYIYGYSALHLLAEGYCAFLWNTLYNKSELPETRCETERCSSYTLVTEVVVVIMTDLRLANKSPLSPYDSCLRSSVGFTCTWPEAPRNSFPWWFRPCLDFINLFIFPSPSRRVSIINHALPPSALASFS